MKYPTLKPFYKETFISVEDYEIAGVKVPAGFITNGADIPRVFWSIFPPNYPGRLGAILVHDYLTYGDRTDEEYKYADEKLRDILLMHDQGKIIAYTFYYSCRLWHKALKFLKKKKK